MTLDANPKWPLCVFCFPRKVDATVSIFGIFVCDKESHQEAAKTEAARATVRAVQDLEVP